jgi:hypothetical protein
LQIEQIQLATLIPYINNSRTHSDEQVAQIAASIKEFGFNNPILVDKDSGIIAGHGRLQAARKLGLTEVPCVRLEHLTETQRKAYIIADNRLALNAGWDNELLTIELNELLADGFALEILGFDSDELKTLLDPLEPTEGLVDEDQVPEVPEEPKTKPGDIYQLGRHRLMCGDSTSIDGPAHQPTDQGKLQVKTLAAVGIRHEDIAAKIGISADTLTKYYRQELDDGRIDANAQVGKSLYEQAKNGNTTAMIFWLKTRAGWKETQVQEHTGPDGTPLVVNWPK